MIFRDGQLFLYDWEDWFNRPSYWIIDRRKREARQISMRQAITDTTESGQSAFRDWEHSQRVAWTNILGQSVSTVLLPTSYVPDRKTPTYETRAMESGDTWRWHSMPQAESGHWAICVWALRRAFIHSAWFGLHRPWLARLQSRIGHEWIPNLFAFIDDQFGTYLAWE